MRAYEVAARIRENVSKVMVGKDAATNLLLIALFTGGHVLIEDVPGSGKTKIAKTFARSVGCSFGRIQFTPDLLPSDITGVKYFNMKTSEFEFIPGPAFTNILLADELNRATPKTQAGLLECMEERQITVEGETMTLPELFMVIATQNPIENMGVFPLPEAQLDRFLLKIPMSYPTRSETVGILQRFSESDPLDTLGAVCGIGDVLAARREVAGVFVHADIMGYIADIVAQTRNASGVLLGGGTRSTLALLSASKGMASLSGRNYVIPDDVKALSVPVLAHRLILKNYTGRAGDAADKVISDVLNEVKVPSENFDKYKL
ncbi:MAG: MoxR family ATPase [Clostridia bacterium]|nr:MoxR family ATPase [Clostridia bacterium]